jgi:hypothetical protein
MIEVTNDQSCLARISERRVPYAQNVNKPFEAFECLR